ncbi:MAG: glycosyltransferase family 2 protein [Selenomonadaceae bacterium]|nr:glycosyltransferase family 2 protein [Selenomonadaceae bacterium]MBQ7628674.1 glycosyltransferase family 2 protein [Selenomonadaceae bacterium]
MKNFEKQNGVPKFTADEFSVKTKNYVVLIPIINEGERIINELKRAQVAEISKHVDIVICDGGSTDGCTDEKVLRSLDVNTLLVKKDFGKQGAQLRMGIFWSLQRGYKGILTIDGNDKDSIEDVPKFIEKLKSGYDFVQGSRFIEGGKAINTPLIRYLAVRLIHAPIISLTARHWFTDTTNAYRAYSAKYLSDERVKPLRDIFSGYELLAYLSTRATQLDYRACEIPVTRAYPPTGKTPTKISFWKGNSDLMKVLLKNFFGAYTP